MLLGALLIALTDLLPPQCDHPEEPGTDAGAFPSLQNQAHLHHHKPLSRVIVVRISTDELRDFGHHTHCVIVQNDFEDILRPL